MFLMSKVSLKGLETVPRRRDCAERMLMFTTEPYLRLGFGVSGFGLWISDFRLRISGFGFQVSDFGFQVSGFRLVYPTARFVRYEGLAQPRSVVLSVSRVKGLGSGVEGSELNLRLGIRIAFWGSW